MFFHAPHKIITCIPLYLYNTLGNFSISECPKARWSLVKDPTWLGQQTNDTHSCTKWYETIHKPVRVFSYWRHLPSVELSQLPLSFYDIVLKSQIQRTGSVILPEPPHIPWCYWIWLLQATSFRPHQVTTFFCGLDRTSGTFNISILRGKSSRDKATHHLFTKPRKGYLGKNSLQMN